MPNLLFAEPGGDADQGLSFYNQAGGSLGIDPGTFHSGVYSIKCSGTSSAGATVGLAGYTSDAGSRSSIWVRLDAYPTQTTYLLQHGRTADATGVGVLGIAVQSTGQLCLATGTAPGVTILGTGAMLALNTWTQLALSMQITSTTVYVAKSYVNAQPDITGSGTLGNTGTNRVLFGLVSIPGTTVNCWVDDVVIDDASDGSNPGDVRCTNKRPFANGTANTWTTRIGTGGSGYGTGHAPQVNERPASNSNGWSITGVSTAEEYTIEGLTVGDVDLTSQTIKYLYGWVIVAASVASSAVQLVVAGNLIGNPVPTTPTWIAASPAGVTTYPGGGTDIGAQAVTTSVTYSLYECGLVVVFSPPASAAQVGVRTEIAPLGPSQRADTA